MAESFNLGQVAPISKGNYAAGTQYKILNTVYASGGTWMCIKPAIGIEPGITPDWQQYWVPVAKGLLRTDVSSAGTGRVSITFYYSDGTNASYTFNSTALADNSVGTQELKPKSVTKEKMASNSVGSDQIESGAVTKDKAAQDLIDSLAPAYEYSPDDLIPGSSPLETGTLWIKYE